MTTTKEAGEHAAALFFYASPAAAQRVGRLLERARSPHKVVGRVVVQYGREPQPGIDAKVEGCLQ